MNSDAIRTIDKAAKGWMGRERHPADRDEGEVYFFKEKPTKGIYDELDNYYFWRVTDPSNKIRLSAGVSFMLGIKPGALHVLLKAMGELE